MATKRLRCPHDPIALAKSIYARTSLWYGQMKRRANGATYGYKILYGPPYVGAPILFIGYQPGGSGNDADKGKQSGERTGWPEICEYATAKWPLARQMRYMFGEDTLKRCVGLNAIFLRSPSIQEYRRTFDAQARAAVWQFCRQRVEEIIAVLQPQRIVLIGFSTARLFGAFIPDLLNQDRRVLTRIGCIAGQSAIATLHLTGAQISSSDRCAIKERILRFRSN